MARNNIINPIIIMIGKPTEMIFKDGADLVIIPRPILINRTEIRIGKAITSPPKNKNGVHSIK